MLEKNLQELSVNYLLCKLDRFDRDLLAANLQPTTFERGAVLQEPGRPIEKVVFPKSGLLSLLSVMQTGQNIHVATVGRESAIGASVGLAAHRLAPYRAVVQVECECHVIDAAPFARALDQSPMLRASMSRCYDAQVALAVLTAGCNAMHRLSYRLSRWILQICDGGQTDVVHVTHEALAEWLGAQRSTVTSLTRAMEREGLIESGRGRLIVRDREGLQARACNCYDGARRVRRHYLEDAP